MRFGPADARVTGHAGVAAVTEADRVLGIADALDCAVGPVKQRDRGLSAGGLVLSLACAQLAGEDFLVGMDRRRADTAGQLLEPVPTPASTTPRSWRSVSPQRIWPGSKTGSARSTPGF